MEANRIAVIGVANPQSGVAVLATLATYFGERPLDVCLYDPDLELLDLYDRFMRLLCKATRCTHRVTSTDDEAEAFEGSERIIFQLSPRSAKKYFQRPGEKLAFGPGPVQAAVDELIVGAEPDAEVFSLLGPEIVFPRPVDHLPGWPPSISAEDVPYVLHQIHRYLVDEEPLFTVIAEGERSPLRRWIDGDLLG